MSNWPSALCILPMSWMQRKIVGIAFVLAATLLSAVDSFFYSFGGFFIATGREPSSYFISLYLALPLALLAFASIWFPRTGFLAFATLLLASIAFMAEPDADWHAWVQCADNLRFAFIANAF